MQFFQTRIGSWTLLGIAGCLWIGVIFFGWSVAAEKSSLESSQSSANALEVQQASATRMRSLAHDTKDTRGKLDTLAHVDVVSMVDAIDAVGKDAGVFIQIGQALPESGKSGTLRGVTFQVGADGSFNALMRSLALLATLPLPASLDQAQLVYSGEGTTAGWHMSAHVRILSTADISS